MRIACIGKGGSGKTTAAALLAHTLAKHNRVLALDADINQHLARHLNVVSSSTLGDHQAQLKQLLVGCNPRISANQIIKTSPPGSGSKLFNFAELEGLPGVEQQGNLLFARAGDLGEADVGHRCFHAQTGLVELVLNHLVDALDEYVICDMTAGTDTFASGLFTMFDLTLLVVEPSISSIEVVEAYIKKAQPFSVNMALVVNKLMNQEELDFVESRLGMSALATMPVISELRLADNVTGIKSEAAEEMTAKVVAKLAENKPNYAKRYADMLTFHNKNCTGWANTDYGADLTAQIDPDFDYAEVVSTLLKH